MISRRTNVFIVLLMLYFLLNIISCSSIDRISKPGEYVKLYPISKNGTWGYTNENGDLTIEYLFDETRFFTSGLGAVKQNEKFGFINKTGTFEIKPKYDSVSSFGLNETLVYKNEKPFWIDRKGKKLRNFPGRIKAIGGGALEASDPLDFFEEIDNKFALKNKFFEQQMKYDPTAEYSIKDFTFERVISFSSKSLIVSKNNRTGIFIHFNGVGLIDFWADEIIPFHPELKKELGKYEAKTAKFRVGEQWGIISDMGRILLEPEYFAIERPTGIFYFVEYLKDHWGYLTFKNKFFKL